MQGPQFVREISMNRLRTEETARRWRSPIGAMALATLMAAGLGAQEQRTFFDSADNNHDGTVTREEFLAATAKWLGPGPTADESQLKAAIDPGFPESVFAAMLRG